MQQPAQQVLGCVVPPPAIDQEAPVALGLGHAHPSAHNAPCAGELPTCSGSHSGWAWQPSIILGFVRDPPRRHRPPPGMDDTRVRFPSAPAPRCSPKALEKRSSAPGALTTDLSPSAGWTINLAVAEYVIRRHGSRRTISRPTTSRPTTTATANVGSS